MIEISLSTYHRDPKISREDKAEMDADIRHQIELVRFEHRNTGYRTLLHHLKRRGVKIGETRLRRVMKEFQLHIKQKRKFVRTTDSNHKNPVHPNLLKGREVTDINQVWVADITYIRIQTGFVFLAVILDLYSRKVIGWAISQRIDHKLALSALLMAIRRRKPPKGAIHHTDRGVQYLCDRYMKVLSRWGFQASHSAKGNPYDNAFAERFMRTLKYDEVYLWNYKTILDVIERVPYFIEEVYNKKRLHSSLDYLSPKEFEEKIEVNPLARQPLKL